MPLCNVNSSTLSLPFDILRILISSLDILSDVYITYLFWLNEEYTYFYISISIILLTQLSYSVIFLYLFKFNCNRCLIMFILLPISPLLSFLFYLTATDDNECSKYLQKLFQIRNVRNNFTDQKPQQLYQSKDPIQRFIQTTTRKHIGFICESIMESFCQLILQLCFILHTTNITQSMQFMHYFSILLSLLSIILSLYIFCHSIYFKLFVFNYVCIICDFMKLFTCILCTDALNPINHALTSIWIYKLLFVTSIASLYISVQFISNKIDLNYNLYQLKTNFGVPRRRSLSLSHSKSKSRSKSTLSNKSNASNKSNKSLEHNHHLSTYHISTQHSKDNKLKEFIKIFITDSKCLSEIIFSIVFSGLVCVLWPFMLLFLEIFSFSLIAFMIDKANTSRFLSIHWNLWEYIFDFLLSKGQLSVHKNKYSETELPYMHSRDDSMTYTPTTTQASLHSTDDSSYVSNDDFILDRYELEVKLNTLANSGNTGNHRKDRSKTMSRKKRKTANKNVRQIYTIIKTESPFESAEKDLLIRLSTVNYVLSQHRGENKKLYNYLNESLQTSQFGNVTLKELKYYASSERSNIFAYNHEMIIEKWYALNQHSKSVRNKCLCFYHWKKCQLLLKWLLFFVILPLYVALQILFIIYPYILFISNSEIITTLKCILMSAYSLCIVLLLCLFCAYIYKFTKITSYIHHNSILYFTSYNAYNSYQSSNVERKMITDIQELYQNLVATQIRLNLLRKAFGSDICDVVLSYLPSFHIVVNKKHETDLIIHTQLNDNNNRDETGVITQLNGFDSDNEKSENKREKMSICVTPAKNENNKNSRRNPLLLTNANISGHSGHSGHSGNDTDHSNHSNMSLTPN